MVKPHVINSKNYPFSGIEKGAEASAAVMSIIETAKRNNNEYGYMLLSADHSPQVGCKSY